MVMQIKRKCLSVCHKSFGASMTDFWLAYFRPLYSVWKCSTLRISRIAVKQSRKQNTGNMRYETLTVVYCHFCSITIL